MALRDQPYIPLYIQDFLTDEKLNECCASSVGVYIKIMCLMHKHDPYGKILLKQKDKQVLNQIIDQSDNQINLFSLKFAKLLPFDFDTINAALVELIDEKVLDIEGDFIVQKRMIRDNELSLKRSLSGKEGGETTQKNNKNNKKFAKANSQANSEYESEYENEDKINKNEVKIGFDIFWNLYDKKVGNTEKLTFTWNNLSIDEQKKAIEHIPIYKASKGNKRFTKDPLTYLSDKSFNDEIININGHTVETKDETFSLL